MDSMGLVIALWIIIAPVVAIVFLERMLPPRAAVEEAPAPAQVVAPSPPRAEIVTPPGGGARP